MKFADNMYTLATGRQFYANHGILGLGPERSELTEGYDGSVREDYIGEDEEQPAFLPSERQEIAEEMVRRWLSWVARLEASDG